MAHSSLLGCRTPALDHLRSQIMTLPESERAELAHDLIKRLDTLNDDSFLANGNLKSKKRIAAQPHPQRNKPNLEIIGRACAPISPTPESSKNGAQAHPMCLTVSADVLATHSWLFMTHLMVNVYLRPLAKIHEISLRVILKSTAT